MIIIITDYHAYLVALSGDYCYSEQFSYLLFSNSDPNKGLFESPLFAIFDFESNKGLVPCFRVHSFEFPLYLENQI